MPIIIVSFENFGPELRRIRKSKGLTQIELAEKLGELRKSRNQKHEGVTTNQQIGRIELGHSARIELINEILEALDVKAALAINLDDDSFIRLQQVENV